jgi:hypothetical protein
MTLRISAVLPQDIPHIWSKVEPLLGRAVPFSKGRFKTEDFLKKLLTCEWQLWVMFDENGIFAAATTGVADYPRRRVLVCQMCGGDRMNEWLKPFHKILVSYATDCNCDGLELVGRKGWGRWLEEIGFTNDFVTFGFDIKRVLQ